MKAVMFNRCAAEHECAVRALRLGFLTRVVGLGGARRGEGVEDREAAVGERGCGRGVHDRVTAGIDHVTCHRGGRGADDRGWNTMEGEQVVHRSDKCFLFSIPLFATHTFLHFFFTNSSNTLICTCHIFSFLFLLS